MSVGSEVRVGAWEVTLRFCGPEGITQAGGAQETTRAGTKSNVQIAAVAFSARAHDGAMATWAGPPDGVVGGLQGTAWGKVRGKGGGVRGCRRGRECVR